MFTVFHYILLLMYFVTTGAVLASPKNKQLNRAMRNLMNNTRVSSGGIFTGIHATFSKGDFFSIEGLPSDRMPVEWMPDEPDNKNNDEDCIMFASNGTIADVHCNELHPYMCFKTKTADMVLNQCGTYDPEYNLDTRTGSCYKLHGVAKNWTRTFMTCAAEGAHLAIVNNEAEADALRELFEKSSAKGFTLDIESTILIGFLDWNERGVWTTIHGKSLSEAGFDQWFDNRRKYISPNAHCGGLEKNAKLLQAYCQERGPFVCEKTPESLITAGDVQNFVHEMNLYKIIDN